MLIKTPTGNYVFYKETDSIVIKKKNIEEMYDEPIVTILFIMLVRENGTQLLLDVVGNTQLIQGSTLMRMAEREVENLVLNIVKNKELDIVEMIRPSLKEIEREIRELRRYEM
ncbi:MAG: hypothetical protein MR384_09075 [Lachnospiraceae bacterium]|nr:hypothetical protein [Lachnospiraceae bacterium]